MKTVNWNNYNISKLCLGTVQFGLDYGIANSSGEISQKEVNYILDYVVSKDINCFDTGSMYGNSEEKIGNYLKENENDVRVISKIKSDFFEIDEKSAIDNINKSLEYLSVDTLFALLLHNIDAVKNWDEKSTKLITRLKIENKIKYFGVSIYNDEEFILALENDNVDVIQIPFNLLDQRAIKNNWLQKAKEKNKLIFIRSVYLQGLLLMDIENIPDHLNGAKQYLQNIEQILNKLNITKNELALSFVDQMADSGILLFGCDNLNQAKQNIENYNNLQLLDSDTLKLLDDNVLNIDEYIYNPSKWNTK
jgi:aryl-alcohol dehydrogenase-like predicted oxidoreductase